MLWVMNDKNHVDSFFKLISFLNPLKPYFISYIWMRF